MFIFRIHYKIISQNLYCLFFFNSLEFIFSIFAPVSRSFRKQSAKSRVINLVLYFFKLLNGRRESVENIQRNNKKENINKISQTDEMKRKKKKIHKSIRLAISIDEINSKLCSLLHFNRQNSEYFRIN